MCGNCVEIDDTLFTFDDDDIATIVGSTREDDVDAKGGTISHLTMPIQEMRQHKAELCLELFGVETVRTLDMRQRLTLARTLRSRYNSSVKQITRLCGLVYEESKDLI